MEPSSSPKPIGEMHSIPGTTDPHALEKYAIHVQPKKKVLPPIPRSFSSPILDKSDDLESGASPPRISEALNKKGGKVNFDETPTTSPSRESPGGPTDANLRKKSIRASTGMLATSPGEGNPTEPLSSSESIFLRLYRRVKTMVDVRPSHLHLFVGTWNMHGKIPNNMELFLPDPQRRGGWLDLTSMFRLDEGQHLLVFGTQECQKSIQESVLFPSKAEWEKRLKLFYQEQYEMIASETMAALHLCIFIRKKLRPYLVVEKRSVPTGIGGVVGNKGGVAIGLQIEKTTFLFVNLHLTAHQHNTLLRNSDYQKIETELKFSRFKANQALISDSFDYVFFLGDTNYRIDAPATFMQEWAKNPTVAAIRSRDQLSREQHARRTFIGFTEPEIEFLPTFKLLTTGKGYNLKRIPAWTDRILFKSNGSSIECLKYTAITEQTGSDHAPVIGIFDVALLEKEQEGAELKKKRNDKLECFGCLCCPWLSK